MTEAKPVPTPTKIADIQKMAQTATDAKVAAMLREYAADIEREGRAHAPQWMREAADRIEAIKGGR
jgi:hypothetical protein